MRLRFLYKVYSPFDGFRPEKIPSRFGPKKTLSLGWRKYLDEVESGTEVWVFFHDGVQKRIKAGVYAKGRVTEVDWTSSSIRLRVDAYDTQSPIIDDRTADRIRGIVARRGQQVFPLPTYWAPMPRGFTCSLDSDGTTCGARQCIGCPVWMELRSIRPSELNRPPHLSDRVGFFTAAFWVIPARSFIYSTGKPQREIVHTSDLFYSFKHGAADKAFPLALAMSRALDEGGFGGADAIVPIPLSPDKARRGEIHRSRLLARELGRLLDVPVREWLRLSRPISKRRSRNMGLTDARHRSLYQQYLEVSPSVRRTRCILIVDDVSTKGGTLNGASAAIESTAPSVDVNAVTAGQMVVKAVVADPESLVAEND